jgi:hypothetical protein
VAKIFVSCRLLKALAVARVPAIRGRGEIILEFCRCSQKDKTVNHFSEIPARVTSASQIGAEGLLVHTNSFQALNKSNQSLNHWAGMPLK